MDNDLIFKKRMSMYLSVKPSGYEELFYKHLKCDIIYSRDFKGGTLYCVSHTNPGKTHKALDSILQLIESEIEPDMVGLKFQCISTVLSQKVKTFAANQQMSDELFNAIFTGTNMGCKTGRKVHADVRMWVPPSEAAAGGASKRRRVDNPAGGAFVDGLNAKAAELEQRLGASEAKEREAQATIAGLEQRLGAADAKEREAWATIAELQRRVDATEAITNELGAKAARMAELEQRLGASEAKECEAHATIAELEQCLGATEAKLNELGAKVADAGQQEKASVERERRVANNLEKARAQMKDVEERYFKWRKFGEEENAKAKLWAKEAEEAEAKAVAWDAHIGRINDNLMRQAMGTFLTTPLQKMVNLAKLAGVAVQPADTYHEVRKNVLLKVHPDKRRCAFDKDALFERICVAVGEMPAHV
jgi:hypothetical protein